MNNVWFVRTACKTLLGSRMRTRLSLILIYANSVPESLLSTMSHKTCFTLLDCVGWFLRCFTRLDELNCTSYSRVRLTQTSLSSATNLYPELITATVNFFRSFLFLEESFLSFKLISYNFLFPELNHRFSEILSFILKTFFLFLEESFLSFKFIFYNLPVPRT